MRTIDDAAGSGSGTPAAPPDHWNGPPVDPAADAALLQLARATMAAVLGGPPLDPAQESLPSVAEAPLGAFVTLTIDGELRGCMGRLDFDRPLRENLVGAAVAVTRDPRFEPLGPVELGDVRVEVSLLSAPVEIEDPGEFDAQRHGIIVQRGFRQALLLPQVAQERGWDERTTLRAVCQKAGLDRDAWREPGTRLAVFVVHSAEEADPIG